MHTWTLRGIRVTGGTEVKWNASGVLDLADNGARHRGRRERARRERKQKQGRIIELLTANGGE